MWLSHLELPFHLFTWTAPPTHFFLHHPWLLFLFQLEDHIWFGDLIAYYGKQQRIWMPIWRRPCRSWAKACGLEGMWRMKTQELPQWEEVTSLSRQDQYVQYVKKGKATSILQVKIITHFKNGKEFHVKLQSYPYPLWLGCYSFPASHPGTGSSGQVSFAAIPPGWGPQPHP